MTTTNRTNPTTTHSSIFMAIYSNHCVSGFCQLQVLLIVRLAACVPIAVPHCSLQAFFCFSLFFVCVFWFWFFWFGLFWFHLSKSLRFVLKWYLCVFFVLVFLAWAFWRPDLGVFNFFWVLETCKRRSGWGGGGGARIYLHTYIYICMYIYIYV